MEGSVIKTHARIITALVTGASLWAWGQQESLAMPEWLAPFPQARGQSATARSTEGTLDYTALARAADVISHYEQQMRNAGATFRTQDDGIGVSTVASKGKISAVIRFREQDGVTKVRVSYALQADPPAAPEANPQARAAVPQQAASVQAASVPGVKRVALSPFAHAPYQLVMQSSVLPTKPVRYAAFTYVVRTNGTIEGPLNLSASASIVDAFPDDCEFSMRDLAGHSFTFKKAVEARGKTLSPGTWSAYPMKCNGIVVYLN